MSVRETFGPDATDNQSHSITPYGDHVWAGGYMSFQQSPVVPAAVAGTDAAQLAYFDDVLDNYATLAADNDMSTMEILFDEAPFLDSPLEEFTTPNELVTKARLDALAAAYDGVNENVTTVFTATNTFTADTLKSQNHSVTTGNVDNISGKFGGSAVNCFAQFQCLDTVQMQSSMYLGANVKISNAQGVLWAPGALGNFITVPNSAFAGSNKAYTTPLFTALPWTSTFFITDSTSITGQIFYFNGNGFDGQSVLLINARQPTNAITVTSNVSTTRFVQPGSNAEAASFAIIPGAAYQLFQTTINNPTTRTLWTIVQVDQL